jgi:hypothetical protein
MQVLHQASTEVKALKRKFEQQEAQGQQPSAKRALVAEPDPATDSPRILSCQRWQVPPSPISARNQQEQPGEGAAGPKAPTPAAPASHQSDYLRQMRTLPEAGPLEFAAPALPAQAQAPAFSPLYGMFGAAAGAGPGPATGPRPGVGSVAAAAAAAAGSAPPTAAAAAAGDVGGLRLRHGGASTASGPAV